MKKIFTVSMTILLIMLFFFSVNAQEKNEPKEKKKKTETVKIKAPVTCNNCKQKIEKNIAFEKGVKFIEADVETNIVTIKFDSRKNTPEKLAEALKKLGYSAEIIKE